MITHKQHGALKVTSVFTCKQAKKKTLTKQLKTNKTNSFQQHKKSRGKKTLAMHSAVIETNATILLEFPSRSRDHGHQMATVALNMYRITISSRRSSVHFKLFVQRSKTFPGVFKVTYFIDLNYITESHLVISLIGKLMLSFSSSILENWEKQYWPCFCYEAAHNYRMGMYKY